MESGRSAVQSCPALRKRGGLCFPLFYSYLRQYLVYILFSSSRNHFNFGHTHNIVERLKQHNAGRTPSTKRGRPWRIVYQEAFPDKTSAIIRELEIKKMKSKVYIEKLIKSES